MHTKTVPLRKSLQKNTDIRLNLSTREFHILERNCRVYSRILLNVTQIRTKMQGNVVEPIQYADIESLILNNQALVGYVLNNYFKYIPQNSYEDLQADGYLALVKAANTFDPSYGIKFATYAIRCIQNEIQMALYKSQNTIHIGRNSLAAFSRCCKQIDDPSALTESDLKVLDAEGLTPEKFRAIFCAKSSVSLEDVSYRNVKDGKDLKYSQKIVDIHGDKSKYVELTVALEQFYEQLDDKAEKCIVGKWLDCANGGHYSIPTDAQLGTELGWTQSYVCRKKNAVRVKFARWLGGDYY